MKIASSPLHALVGNWVRARLRWVAGEGPPSASALKAVGAALDALRRHGQDGDWEGEIDNLPPELGQELRRWRFHSPDVEVDHGHASGLPFSQAWWLPFSLWDDAAFAVEGGVEDLPPPALLLQARVGVEHAIDDIHRTRPSLSGTRVSIEAGAPLDIDRVLGPLPGRVATGFHAACEAPHLALRRGEKWLNAGLLPLVLRSSSSAGLAWSSAWLAHRLDDGNHDRGRMGSPSDLRTAIGEAGLLRWLLWSEQLLSRAAQPGSRLAMTLTVVRWGGRLLELRGLAQEDGGPPGSRLWRGRVCLFEEQAYLGRALGPWLRLDNPSAGLRMESVEEAITASSWAAWPEQGQRIH